MTHSKKKIRRPRPADPMHRPVVTWTADDVRTVMNHPDYLAGENTPSGKARFEKVRDYFALEAIGHRPPEPETQDQVQEPASAKNSPEQEAFRQALFEADDPVEEIALKPARSWTESEQEQVARKTLDLPSGDPRREHLDAMRHRWFSHRYGDDPVKYGATGRMIDPEPKNWIPADSVEVEASDGGPIHKGLGRIGALVERHAEKGSFAPSIRSLQTGLNILSDTESERRIMAGEPPEPFDALKEDGDFGPKSRLALKRALTNLGPGKVEEGYALGRFRQLAGSGDGASLGEEIDRSFAPLFPGARNRSNPDARRVEIEALQTTLNDIGRKEFGPRDWRPIAEDGHIGPGTLAAFNRIAKVAGPQRLTRRFGANLGFL